MFEVEAEGYESFIPPIFSNLVLVNTIFMRIKQFNWHFLIFFINKEMNIGGELKIIFFSCQDFTLLPASMVNHSYCYKRRQSNINMRSFLHLVLFKLYNSCSY
jgi:hypothetical protein